MPFFDIFVNSHGLTLPGQIAGVAAVVSLVCLLGYAAFGGTRAASLEDLTTAMDGIKADFKVVNGHNAYKAEDQVILASADNLRSAIPTFLKNVRTAYPFFFDEEGNPLYQTNFEEDEHTPKGSPRFAGLTHDTQTYGEELVKLRKKLDEQDPDLVMVEKLLYRYFRLNDDLVVKNLPKDLQQIADTKADIQRKNELVRQVDALSQKISTASAFDQALDSELGVLVKEAEDLRMNKQFEKTFIGMYKALGVLRRGGSPVVGPKLVMVQLYDLKTEKPIPGKQISTAEEPADHKAFRLKYEKTHGTGNKPTAPSKKKENKGMSGWWWVVIIGGILAVLGVVAYLFLGSDPSNGEEFAPEEEP